MGTPPHGLRDIKKVNVTNTGAVTDAQVIAGVSGKQLIVQKLLFVTTAATTFLLEEASSTTLIGTIPSVTGLNSFTGDDLEACKTATAGNPIRYTTSAGNSWIYAEYYEAS